MKRFLYWLVQAFLIFHASLAYAETISAPGILLPWSNSRTVTTNTSVTAADGIIYVDASGGAVTVTYDVTLITYNRPVQIIKTDTTANAVLISDGTNIVDTIVAPATALGQIGGERDVYSNGTNLVSTGGGASLATTSPVVVSATTTAPPGSPAAGAMYIVPAGATGAWSGWAGSLTVYNGAAWVQIAPQTGAQYTALDTGIIYAYNGGFTPTVGKLSLAPSYSALDTAAAALGVQALADVPFTISTTPVTLTAQWNFVGGIITHGSNALTFSKIPSIPSGTAAFNAADSGILTVPTGTELSPRAFGAACNSTTDDTSAVQSVFNVVTPNSIGEGGTGLHAAILFDGLCLTTAEIVAPTTNNGWHIRGLGKFKTGILDSATGNSNILSFSNDTQGTVSISDMKISGTTARKTGGGTGVGLLLTNARAFTNVSLRDVNIINNPGDGFQGRNFDQLYMNNVWSQFNNGNGFTFLNNTASPVVTSVTSTLINVRADDNGLRGWVFGSTYRGYTFISLESLNNNQLGSSIEEVYFTGTADTGFIFESPDIENFDGVSTSTVGMDISGSEMRIDTPLFNLTGGTISINGRGLKDSSIIKPTYGSHVSSSTVTLDGTSLRNDIKLLDGQALTLNATGDATNTVSYGGKPSLVYHSDAYAATVTIDMANLGGSNNGDVITGCNGNLSLASPANSPAQPTLINLKIVSSSTSCNPTAAGGSTWVLNGAIGTPSNSVSTWIGQFQYDGTNYRQVGLGYWQ